MKHGKLAAKCVSAMVKAWAYSVTQSYVQLWRCPLAIDPEKCSWTKQTAAARAMNVVSNVVPSMYHFSHCFCTKDNMYKHSVYYTKIIDIIFLLQRWSGTSSCPSGLFVMMSTVIKRRQIADLKITWYSCIVLLFPCRMQSKSVCHDHHGLPSGFHTRDGFNTRRLLSYIHLQWVNINIKIKYNHKIIK